MRGAVMTGGQPIRDVEERRAAVLQHVLASGSAQVDELAALLDVSRMTVHRDLDSLEQQGLIRKVRGGATAQPSMLFESHHFYREKRRTTEKRVLARAAADMIEPGMALIVDDSTTTAALMPFLPEKAPLSLITNALGVIEGLKAVDGIDLIALGGEYSRTFNAFLGLVAEQAVQALRADLLVMSASAVQGLTLYHQDQRVVRVKRAMMAAADRRLLLLDSSKIGKSALNRLAEMAEFHAVLVDSGLDAERAAAIRQADVNLTLV